MNFIVYICSLGGGMHIESFSEFATEESVRLSLKLHLAYVLC